MPSVFVEPGVRTGMPVLVDNPKEVGADRIADAVAAFERYGGPTIVVDFGTATNFEVVSAKGEYLGGVLVPGDRGFPGRFDSESRAAAPGGYRAPQEHPGQEHGGAASVRHLLWFCRPGRRGLRQDEGRSGPATVVATGGLAPLVLPATKVHRPLRAMADPVRPAHHLPSEPLRWLRTSRTGSRSQPRPASYKSALRPAGARPMDSGEVVTVAGRIMLRREMGKLTFITLTDWTGSVQLFAGAQWTDRFGELNKLSLGDWVGGHRRGGPHPDRRTFGPRCGLGTAGRSAPSISRQMAWHNRHRHALPPALRRHVGQRTQSREVLLARSRAVSAVRRFLEDQGLCRGRNACFPYRPRRRDGQAICHPPQCPRYGPLPAHRARTAPEATGRGRNGEGVRNRPCVPQRRPFPPPQPRVHHARAVPGVRRLPRHDGPDRTDRGPRRSRSGRAARN